MYIRGRRRPVSSSATARPPADLPSLAQVGDHTPCDVHLGCDGLDWYRKRGRVLYVYRETPAVMVSQRHFMAATDQSLLEYMRQPNRASTGPYCDDHATVCRRAQAAPGDYVMGLSRAKYHQYHVVSWLRQPDVLHLSFGELQNEREASARKLSQYLGLPLPPNVFDATKDHSKAVSFRSGKTDAWRSEMPEDALRWLEQELSTPLNTAGMLECGRK